MGNEITNKPKRHKLWNRRLGGRGGRGLSLRHYSEWSIASPVCQFCNVTHGAIIYITEKQLILGVECAGLSVAMGCEVK